MDAKSKKQRTDWIVCDSSKGLAFVCLRCKAEYRPNLPVPVEMYAAMGRAFEKTHRRCKEPATPPPGPLPK